MEESIYCNQCDNLTNSNSKFCSNCGEKLRCSVCDETLVKNAKFCSSCGTSTIKISENNQQPLNKIKFKETKDERAYEVTFTDTVGSEVTNVVMNMFQNNKNLLGSQTLGNLSIDEIESISNIDAKVDVIEADIIDHGESEYSHLNELLLNLELSEKDWIIVFSFYLSEFGNGYFTKELVTAKYKEHRNSKPHMKNFAANYRNAHKQCFSTVNNDNLRFSQVGLKIAVSLINGEIKSHANKNTNKNKKKSETIANTKTKVTVKSKNIKIDEFDAYSSKPTLVELFEEIKPVSTNERILTIAYYINKILKTDFFTDGNVDYAYKLLKLDKRPNLLRQIITNIRTKELWFDKSEDGKDWKLNRTGEIHFESKVQKN
jgi:hypothetical protein